MAGHNHSHSVNNSDNSEQREKKLLITVVLNFVITIAEIVGGFLSNSLALLSDALHNLSDAVALLIAYIAIKVSKRESNHRKTFGYKRVEILSALFNAVALIAICFFLFVEAYERLLSPEPIKGMLMLIVATIGLLANLISVVILHKDKSHNINIKAAYLHLIGDTLSSVAVIAGGLLIVFFEAYWVDPLITFMVGIYIIKETYQILKETINILMQATPQNIDIDEIKGELENLPEIDNIHHVHIWNLSDSETHFECHIDLEKDMSVSRTDSLRRQIDEILADRFNISHTTVQIEFNCCNDKGVINKAGEG